MLLNPHLSSQEEASTSQTSVQSSEGETGSKNQATDHTANDVGIPPCRHVSISHFEHYPQFKGTNCQCRSCPLHNIHEFLLRLIFIPSGHRGWRQSSHFLCVSQLGAGVVC